MFSVLLSLAGVACMHESHVHETPQAPPVQIDREGYAMDQAINCLPEGCINSGPGCDVSSVPGQCSFPKARAVEFCANHPQCVAINCNTTRNDCQARDSAKRDPWVGMKSMVIKHELR